MNPTPTFSPESILSILDRCAGQPMVVIGDLMLDEYIEGAVD